MKQLKAAFEAVGMQSVKTYINSGNVIFSDSSRTPIKLVEILEAIIHDTFDFPVKVLLRDIDNITEIVQALPESWQNNADMKCDVMFLWEHVATESIVEQLIIKPDLDEVKYVSGTILWRVDKKNVTRSGLLRLAGTDLYKQMTIRNCNTTRKLLLLMQEAIDA